MIREGTQSTVAREHVHGSIVSALEDDSLWSCIYSGLVWSNALVWGVAAVIFVFVVSN